MKHEVQLMMQEEPKQRLLSTLRLHKIIFLLVKVIPYYLKKKKKDTRSKDCVCGSHLSVTSTWKQAGVRSWCTHQHSHACKNETIGKQSSLLW